MLIDDKYTPSIHSFSLMWHLEPCICLEYSFSVLPLVSIKELKILGRERLQIRDFLKQQQSARANQRHFVRGFAKKKNAPVSKQVKNTVKTKKADLPAIRITEQPILLTKSEINRPRY